MENKDLFISIVMLLILIICIGNILTVLNNKKIKKTEKKELVPIVNKELKKKIQYAPKLIDPNVYDKDLYEAYYDKFATDVHNSTPIVYRTTTYIKPKRYRRYYRNHR